MNNINKEGRRDSEEALESGFKVIIDLVLWVLFWLALVLECYALYTKNYSLRFYSRTLMIPFLFLRIFNKDVFFSMHFFVYLSLLLSWFGDIMNLIIDYKIQYLASAFYTLSYLTFGIVFYNFNNKKKLFFNYIFYSFFAVLGVIVFFFFYFPTLSDKLTSIHLYLHGLILLYALIWSLTIIKDMDKMGLRYFIPSILIMIFANLLFAVDWYVINPVNTKHYFFERHTSIDVAVAICYGFYIFLFTQGIRHLKRTGTLIAEKGDSDDTYLQVD